MIQFILIIAIITTIIITARTRLSLISRLWFFIVNQV
jgi:hypothetical protein